MVLNRDEILEQFEEFRTEIDDQNDNRERLIKLSREITVQSKRAIFALHRGVNDDQGSSREDHLQKVADRGFQSLHHIRKNLVFQFTKEVSGERDYWLNQRSISPGLQEYIEAVAYAHYLSTGQLITHREMLKWLSSDDSTPWVYLPFSDFILGLSDLTGELMRFAVTSVATRRGKGRAQLVCDFVRGVKADFEGLTPYVRELPKKQSVTRQSLRKIEEANYALTLRSAEYQNAPELLDDIVARYARGLGLGGGEPVVFDGDQETEV